MQEGNTCRSCGRELGFEDQTCPYCGANLKIQRIAAFGKKILMVLAATAILGSVFGSWIQKPLNEQIEKRTFYNQVEELREQRKQLAAPFPKYEVSLEEAAGEECSRIWEDTEAQLAVERELTMDQKPLFQDAVLDLQLGDGLSEKQFMEGLQRSGYSREEILEILPMLEINWNHQALEAALSAFHYSTRSRVQLEEQLNYMGFSEEQIQYALERVHPDYGQQAVLQIYDRLRIGCGSPRDARWALEDAFYTEEEIQWALQNCGVDWKEMAYESGMKDLGVHREYEEDVVENLIKKGFSEEHVRYAAEKLNIPITREQEQSWKAQENNHE